MLAALAVLYVAARVWHLGAVCLDGDEIFSVVLARGGWAQLAAGAVRDAIHPPLFYVLLKLWVSVVGESLVSVRVLPVLISVFALPPLYLLCRDLGLERREVWLAGTLAALNPFLIYYSQDVRMYSLLFTLGLTSMWLFCRVGREPGKASMWWLAVVNIALVYAHYYGWLLMGIEWVYAAWRRRRVLVPFSIAVMAAAIAAAPWMFAAAEAMRAKGGLSANLGWVHRPGLADLIWFYVDLTGSAGFPSTRVAVAPLVVIGAVIATYFWRKQHGELRGFLLAFGLVPCLAPFIASQWATESVWGHRHLIFQAAPFLILTAVAVMRAAHRWQRRAALTTLAVWACVVVTLHVRGDDQKAQWDRMAAAIAQAETGGAGGVPVYALGRNLHYAIGFYVDEITARRTADLTFQPAPGLASAAARIRVYRQGAAPVLPPGNFWIVTPGRALTGELAARGCRGDDPVTIADRYETVSAIRVTCPPSSTM